MLRPIRRVVTGHDANGKAVVLFDGPAPNIVTSAHRPGGRTNIWRTDSAPANYGGDVDEAAADVAFTLEPPSHGVNFRISEYPPEPPEATELTREERRFFRYDRNRDRRITRTEMLSTRTDAFRKLDVDGNNLLTFEEWAVTTSRRFEGADADGNGELTPAEFATTAPKRRKKPACRC